MSKKTSNFTIISDFTTNQLVGILVLYVIICSGFLKDTISCGIQKMFNDNRWIKQIFLFISLFVVISITNKGKNHPLLSLAITVVVYLFFVLSTKMNKFAVIAIIVLLFLLYILNLWKRYRFPESHHLLNEETTIDNLLNDPKIKNEKKELNI